MFLTTQGPRSIFLFDRMVLFVLRCSEENNSKRYFVGLISNSSHINNSFICSISLLYLNHVYFKRIIKTFLILFHHHRHFSVHILWFMTFRTYKHANKFCIPKSLLTFTIVRKAE